MTTPLGSALSAARSGVSGVERAGQLHEQAADTVQRAFHGEGSQTHFHSSAEPATTIKISSASKDLASAFTDMIKADGMNRANIAVIKTADDMQKELTDIVRR